MSADKSREQPQAQPATPELSRAEAREKRRELLAHQAGESARAGEQDEATDAADSTMATLILPGG